MLSNLQKNEGIGSLNEKALHKILKFYYEPRHEYHEIKYLGKVADVLNENGIIEIQTRALEKMNPKLSSFLNTVPVTLVYPLAAIKTVSWIDKETGDISPPRKSPRGEGIFDALFEMSKISEYLFSKSLTLRLVFLDVSEYRYLNGWDKTKKRGSERCMRIPNAIISEIDIKKKSDIISLIDFLPEGEFTAKDFSRISKKGKRKNYYIMKLLLDLEIISFVRKEKLAFVYKAQVGRERKNEYSCKKL